jgi:hypothetical protein
MTSRTAQLARRAPLLAPALIVACCVWAVYAFTLATPGLIDRNGQVKGTDFLLFYNLGRFALEGNGPALYDEDLLEARARELVPGSDKTRYPVVYPPQVAIFFAPLGALPYGWALIGWWTITTLAYAACCYIAWKASPALAGQGATVAAAAAGFPAFVNLIGFGQNSAIALVCFTAAFAALMRGRSFAAGLAIGGLAYKPQLGIVAAVVFLTARNWKLIAGSIVSLGFQLGLSLAYFGPDILSTYLAANRDPVMTLQRLQVKIYQMHSLRTFFALLVPWPAVAVAAYLVAAAIVLAMAVMCWRSSRPLPSRYAGLLIATVLVSPHLYVYDLVLIAPALVFVSGAIVEGPASDLLRRLKTAAHLCYFLPFVGPLAMATRIQPSVPAMAGLLALMTRLSRSTMAKAREASTA